MTVAVPTALAARCGRTGNVAVKWASLAVSTYPELDEDTAAGTATSAAIQPANSRIPTTIGQRASLGGVYEPAAATNLGHGGPVTAAGSSGVPGGPGSADASGSGKPAGCPVLVGAAPGAGIT